MTSNLPAKIQHPLDSTLKQNWLHALRNGQYAQCRLSYRTGERYDPLGVLADLLYPGEWIKLHQIHYIGDTYRAKNVHIHNIRKVIIAAGLSDGVVNQLFEMNDHQGKTFNEIAQWIEGNL